MLIFHSLSKRSNAPGLRSGFAAGGPRAIAALRQLRAYGGAPLPLPLQRAATALWQRRGACRGEPRALPREVRARRPRCSATCPATPRREAGFFLWLRVGDGEAAALRLWRETGVRVLPGGYLGRATADRGEPRPATISAWRWSPTPPQVERGLDGDPRHARRTAIPRKGSDRWPARTQGQAPRAADGERHRGGAAPPRHRARRPVLLGARRARRRDDLDLLARRPEPVQRHRRGAAQRARPGRRLARRPAAPRARLGRLRHRRRASRSGACASCCTPARAAPSAAPSPPPVALLVAAAFAATHVPLAGWTARLRPRRPARRRGARRAALGARRSTSRRRCRIATLAARRRLRRSAPATRSASPGREVARLPALPRPGLGAALRRRPRPDRPRRRRRRRRRPRRARASPPRPAPAAPRPSRRAAPGPAPRFDPALCAIRRRQRDGQDHRRRARPRRGRGRPPAAARRRR